jgi:hypothetical protein
MLTRLLSVFLFGMIGLWEGIPLGFVLGLPPLVIALVSALGSATATLIVLPLGERARAWLARRGGKKIGEGGRLIDRVWRSHGLVGFALLAPCLIGAPLGLATGLLLGAPARRLVPWLMVGIAVWTALMTLAGAYGSAGIRALIVR